MKPTGAISASMIDALNGGWRVVASRDSWDHADMMRDAISHDSKNLDVRVDFRGGRYVIEVR